MRQSTKPSLVQIQTCRVGGVNLLPKPLLTYSQLNPMEVKMESKYCNFVQNAREYVVCKKAAICLDLNGITQRPSIANCNLQFHRRSFQRIQLVESHLFRQFGVGQSTNHHRNWCCQMFVLYPTRHLYNWTMHSTYLCYFYTIHSFCLTS